MNTVSFLWSALYKASTNDLYKALIFNKGCHWHHFAAKRVFQKPGSSCKQRANRALKHRLKISTH